MENVGANSHLAHYTTLDTATSQRTLTEFTKRPNWPQIILQGLRDLLHVLTPDGRILYASPSCEAITGYKSTDLVGRFLIEFIHPDDIAVFIEEFSESIASGNPLRFFYRFRKASEEWVIFESHGHPHTDTQLSSRFVSQRDSIYRGFFLMARPYASNISTMFDSFLENKIEIERLEERIAELKHDKEDRNNAPSRAPTDARREIDASFYHAISPLAQFGMWEPPDASNKGPVHLGEEEISTTVRHQNNTGIQDETLGDLGIPISRYRNGDTRVRIRRKRKKPKVTDQYICNCCGTLDSSEWRKGPDGPKTLCNACGLRWSKKMKAETEST